MTEGNGKRNGHGNGKARNRASARNGSGTPGHRLAYAEMTQLAIKRTLRGIEQRKAAVLAERETRAGAHGFEIVDNAGNVLAQVRFLAEAQAFIDRQAEPERLAIRGVTFPKRQIPPTVRELLEAGEFDDDISAEREFAAQSMMFRS